MAFKIADIFAELSVKSDKYDAGLNAAQGRAGVFGNVLQGIFQGIGQRIFSGIVNGLETVVSKMGDAVTASSNLNESINKTGGVFGNVLQGIFQGIGQRIFSGIVGGLETVVSKMGDAVQASSNLNESINKAGVIFGEGAQQILDWSKTSATAFGLSQQKALEAAASFGALAKQMGGTSEETVAFSETLVKLAADLASFNNLDPTVTLQKLKSGLAGESEPLKAVNVFLNEHIVANRAVQLGLAQSTDSVSESAKVWARYSLILEQTKTAQGDFQNTSQQLANAQRILTAQIENGSASLGNTFRPAITAITNELVDLAPTMFRYAQAAMDQFANGLAAGIRAILPVITTVRQLLAYWFAPGSPPRVAPDIDKWGAAAMGQFFKGFTSVDIKSAISGIGSAIENILRSDVSAGKADEQGLVGRVLGSQSAIVAAVQEFKNVGSVSESTLQRIARSSGSAGGSIAALVKAYFDVQRASDAATRAQEQLNRVTEKYDAILNPLRGQLDSVRDQQQQLANQQRLIAARNTLNNFESTAAEKQAAQLEIQQIALENQISAVEAKKKVETDAAQANVDSAKKEQDAAQAKMDIAQATIDQQVKINNLLGEQRQLEERLAQQREADAKRQQAEAEQAARKAEQEAEKAQRLADQLHQAQLQYNLEISDTPGKIKLMEAELANTKVGSVEYYQILSQIHQLTVQYNHELEQAAKKAEKLGGAELGAGIDTNFTQPIIKTSEAAQNLTKAVQEFFKAFEKPTEKKPEFFVGGAWDTAINKLKGGVDAPVKDEPPPFIKAIVDYVKQVFLPAMDGMGAKIGEIVEFFETKFPEIIAPIKKTIDDLIAVIEERFPIIKKDTEETTTGLMKIWQEHGDILGVWWKLLWKDIEVVLEGAIDIITGVFTAFVGAFTLNWQTWTDGLKLIATGFWVIISGLFVNELARIKANFEEFFPGAWATVKAGLDKLLEPFNQFVTSLGAWRAQITKDLTEWFSGLGKKFYDGGASLIRNLRDGINALLPTLPDWMKNSFGKLTDLLPGSEPKDPSSPFARLDKRGMAFVENFQKGIEAASFKVQPLADSLLAPVTNNNSSTANNMTFNININGGGDVGSIRQGLQDGVLSALRAAGLA